MGNGKTVAKKGWKRAALAYNDQASRAFKVTRALRELQESAATEIAEALSAAKRRDIKAHDKHMRSYAKILSELRARSSAVVSGDLSTAVQSIARNNSFELVGRKLA